LSCVADKLKIQPVKPKQYVSLKKQTQKKKHKKKTILVESANCAWIDGNGTEEIVMNKKRWKKVKNDEIYFGNDNEGKQVNFQSKVP